jgi:hypothetical protein
VNKCFIIPCLFILIGILAACGNVEKKTAVSQPVDSFYYAGTVKADSFKHTFYIKSVGTADLKIDTVVASCDCMTMDWEKKPIKPGAAGFINVMVKPNYEGSHGKVQKTFMVRTNATKKFSIFNIFYII